MALPPFDTPCKIRCTAYAERYADLSGSTTSGPGVIGFHDMGRDARNQQWTFRQLPGPYGYMTINTNANEGTAFANASPNINKEVYGTPQNATDVTRPWWLESLGLGLFRIYCFDCNGIPRFWTLGSERETELIRLQAASSDKTQIWEIKAI